MSLYTRDSGKVPSQNLVASAEMVTVGRVRAVEEKHVSKNTFV
jgi:hypothetical protein